MSDQWSGAEDDVSRLKDMAGGSGKKAASSTGTGTVGSSGATGSVSTADLLSQSEPGSGSANKMDKAKDALSGVSEKATGIGSQATTKADAGMEKAAGGLDSLASKVRERGDSMGEGQVASIAAAAADRMSSGAEMLRGKDTGELVTDLQGLIRRRPVESLLVAAGVGYLISRAK